MADQAGAGGDYRVIRIAERTGPKTRLELFNARGTQASKRPGQTRRVGGSGRKAGCCFGRPGGHGFNGEAGSTSLRCKGLSKTDHGKTT